MSEQDREPNGTGGDLAVAVYTIITAAQAVDWPISATELRFLLDGAHYDPALLRLLITWAETQPPDNAPGWHVPGRPAPSSMKRWFAQAGRYVYGTPAPNWNAALWKSPQAVSVARAALQTIDAEAVLEAASLVGIGRDRFLVTAALIDAEAAERLVADESILDGLPPIDFTGTPDSSASDLLPFLPLSARGELLVKIGWVAAVELHMSGLAPTAASVATIMARDTAAVEETTLCGLVFVWADLLQLRKYRDTWKHKVRRDGVLSRLREYVRHYPDAFTLSAKHMLAHAEDFGSDILDLLAEAAGLHSQVLDVLTGLAESDDDAEVRDQAQGIVVQTRGELPAGGVPIYPHPLTPLSNIWLGSLAVQGTLGNSLRSAADRFRSFILQQGRAQEELVTGFLLHEFESAFRDAELRLTAGGTPLSGLIKVEQRPTVKSEEALWGCDIALLLTVDIPKVAVLELAELVQIKKSQALLGGTTANQGESWRIDVPQLTALLERSQTANYWLIASTGELPCVPARWIHSMGRGRGALHQASFTVGYNDVRHSGIPIEQFLPELLLGTWIGSASPETVNFANGHDAQVKPRYVFSVSVTAEVPRG
ncbi:hypothetical protein ABH920_006685 [Catenulispora sp. EB89]|uniref:hypothetical protein n=1 Tax=Catenulispora sp. EB89 TaxID=3156257 RepID=UPI003510D588